jgi:hypothetical protein
MHSTCKAQLKYKPVGKINFKLQFGTYTAILQCILANNTAAFISKAKWHLVQKRYFVCDLFMRDNLA